MRAIDASSIIFGWENYPLTQFPKLWEWIALEIQNGELIISQVAYLETRNLILECADWLDEKGISKIPINNAILHKAIEIQQLLGIFDDDYHAKGVGENDILIIATSKMENCELINNESIQNNLPQNKKRFKIPAVCDINSIGVKHLDFVGYFKRSGNIFG